MVIQDVTPLPILTKHTFHVCSGKIFLKVLSVHQWWSLLKCGTWHGWAGGKLISGFTQHWKRTQNPASKGPDWAEHTPIEPLLTRVLRCNMGGGSLYGLWKVKSRYLVLSATWEALPWLAGWLAGPRGWRLISKFAENHRQVIRADVQKNGLKVLKSK